MSELKDAVHLSEFNPKKRPDGEANGAAQLLDPKVTHSSAVTALLSEKNIEKAARVCGVSPSAMHRWLRDPSFAQVYADARQAVLNAAIGRLVAASAEAVDTLLSVMNDEDSSTPERLAAARMILEFAFKDHRPK